MVSSNSMARPKSKVDKDLVEKLAAIFCTQEEIAAICGCSEDTLTRRFAAIIKRGQLHGKGSLRRLQWDSAKKGNIGMQIWLGKQMLNQSDSPAPPTIQVSTDGAGQTITKVWTGEWGKSHESNSDQ